MLDGTVVHSCYSANVSFEMFQADLDDLEEGIRKWPGPIIVTGVFNAKSRSWSGGPEDKRTTSRRNDGLTRPDSDYPTGDGNIRKKSVVIGTKSDIPSTNPKEIPMRVDNIGRKVTQ